MARRTRKPSPAQTSHSAAARDENVLRIIGGRHGGRKLRYSGDPRTRPMKERVREAVFNLVGTDAKGKHAIDLFAGTGALGLEALSRGAIGATFLERHFPTARIIDQNSAALGLQEQVRIEPADTFIWARRELPLPGTAWIVFCSPPYAFYHERRDEMLELIERLLARAPAGSVLVVEADAAFDFALLPRAEQWDIRPYPPAVIGVLRSPVTP